MLRVTIPASVLLFFALLTGCETDEPKKTATVPAQASAPTITSPTAQKSQQPNPKIQETVTPKPTNDPADALIAQADKQYAAGQANYQAGHLEAAKASFDQAFNTLLASNLDIRNDERLEREFEKIVEAVHELEMTALKQGDGFTEQRSEPAPIDEANDVTFPVDPNVRAKAEAEIKTTKSDLPLVMNDQVAMFVNYFSNPRGKATLEHAWARSGRYRSMIQQVLKEEGVPQDLIYLAQAESGFQPLALSRAGARGMWQFMAASGELYGLQRTWWVDDRQDPEKSTRAAAHHLKDLYNQFGDWYLAMAAYNSGASTVQHAVERTGYADFWELYRRGVLPQETRNYVPIIVAVTIIAKNPEQYGLERVTPEPAPPSRPGFHQLSRGPAAGGRVRGHFRGLPAGAQSQPAADDHSQGHALHPVFAGRIASQVRTAIAVIPQDMRTYWRYHRVEYGDTLPSIARKYHTSPSSIAEANNLTGDDLQAGAKLIIPISPGRHETQTASFSSKATHYRVRKGDTVTSVADDFEVPTDKLRKWNHLKGTTLVPGRTLVIYKPANSDTASADADPARQQEHVIGEQRQPPHQGA